METIKTYINWEWYEKHSKGFINPYSYDIHGNVKTLVQDNKSITVTGQRFKRIDYDYDLISGKVNKVNYQPNAPDQFIHRYTYDADNRITKVETSSDDIIYQTDAKYFYYAHGPLARVEYGKNQVQGVDYAYTLQGWIKGINSTTLNEKRDIGKDADTTSTNPNKYFARDAMGYALGYYEDDYKPIDQLKWNTVTNRFEAKTVGSQMEGQRYDLYDRHISSMVTTLTQRDTTGGGLANAPVAKPIANAYKYDQAGRVIKSLGFSNIDIPNNLWNSSGQTVNNMYENTFAYDANGNTRKQKRYDSAGVKIEDMTYRYHFDANGKLVKNRLYHINDVVSSGVSSSDIDDQGAFDSIPSTDLNVKNNYRYDEIGNMIADSTEQIDTIKWSMYGKIKEIKRASGSSKKNLKFDYDASGNRVAKHIYSSAGVWQNSTYYVRDAQNNVMSVYDNRVVSSVMSYKLKEQHLHGNNMRIGMVKPNMEMIGADTTNEFLFDTLNKRQYELNNHINNVLTVVYDRKIAVDSNSDNTIDFRLADIASASDYSSFGVKLTGRGFTVDEYRAGFNGKENDNEVKGNGNQQDYGERIYDPRIAKFLSVDPLAHEMPEWSPYSAFFDNPIRYIDEDGRKPGDPIAAGYYAGSMNTRTIGFIVRHPYIAARVGSVSPGSTNISTNTVRFATRLGLSENAAHEGSQVNAFRHALWQASVTQLFGESVAKQIGNAHEDNPFTDLSNRTFTGKNALSQADQTIDLLNNQIGRQIGKDNPKATPQELAAKTLEYQYKQGLYTANTNKDGSISVIQTKITEDQYKKGLETLKGLNKNAFTPAEQQTRDEAAEKEVQQNNGGPRF